MKLLIALVMVHASCRLARAMFHLWQGKYPRDKGTASPIDDGMHAVIGVALLIYVCWLMWGQP